MKGEGRPHALAQVAPGVRVRTSDLYLTTTTVVEGPNGACLVVDPAIAPADMADLAGTLAALGFAPAAGFATHPHWDHVLWSHALGDVERFATARCVETALRERRALWAAAAESGPGHAPDLFGRLTPLPEADGSVPWPGPRALVLAHDAHAPGHAALFLPEVGVLIAGDMLSDVEIPLLDTAAADPVGDYRRGLERLAAVAAAVRILVPGHGHVGDGEELYRRLAADRRYLDDLEAGRKASDARLAEPWLRQAHAAQSARVHG